MLAKLTIRHESGRTTTFPMLDAEVKIGRTAQRNNLVIDDLAVSREHAAIRGSGANYVLTDLGSANGTLVNGVELAGPRTLLPGDVITIGKTTLTFEVEKPEQTLQKVSFGDLQSAEGTVMVSLVPEDLLSALKNASADASFRSTAGQRSAPGPTVSVGALSTSAAAREEVAAPDEITRLRKKAGILSLLYELGRTLGTAFTLPEIYKKAAEMLFKVTPADNCLILLLNKQTGELEPVAIEVNESSKSKGPAHSEKTGLVISRTVTSRVMSEGVALLVYDAQKEFMSSESIMLQAIHSVMCAPMTAKEGLIGAIYVDRRDLLGRFEGEDLDLLSAIASQTAIAIESTMARDQLQKEAIVRQRLGRFLPAGVVERVMAGEIKLGGVSQEVTTLFADIRGFTPMSERASPEVVVEILNEHFSIMTDAVVQYGGTLDKYIGDSVMALFGAPTNNPDVDPVHAVEAAILMQRGMTMVNEKLLARRLPTIRIGIGINTGRVIVGEIGSEKQMNYTAIGDAVNLAARLESNAAPGQILVGESTASHLKGTFRLHALPALKVKGKAEPQPVFEVAWQESSQIED